MFSVYQQLVAWLTAGETSFFVLYFFIGWALWLASFVPGLFYRPARTVYRAPVSVGVTVYSGPQQPLDRIAAVLSSIVAQLNADDELIVALNGPEHPALREVIRRFDVPLIETRIGSKRRALADIADLARHEVVIYADDDSVWLPGVRDELVRPLADPEVGGVTTHQTIERPFSSIAAALGAWLELARFNVAVTAGARLGSILVLPGRTVAWRRGILVANRENLLHDRILGFHAEWSDDTNITWAAHRMGYRTAYQRTAHVTTTPQPTLRALAKQQLRWSRGGRLYMLANVAWAAVRRPALLLPIVTSLLVPFLTVGLLVSATQRIATSRAFAHLAHTHAQHLIVNLGAASTLGLGLLVAVLGASLALTVRAVRGASEQPAMVLVAPLMATIGFILTGTSVLGLAVAALPGSWSTHSGAGVTDRRVTVKQLLPTALALGLFVVAVLVGLLFGH